MKTITIKQLAQLCKTEIANGNGDKQIVVSNDEEGNGYHGLYFGFTPCDEIFDTSPYSPYCMELQGENMAEFITLG